MSYHPHHQTDLPWQPMLLKAAGTCCAVGYNLAAASCAMRAGMAHFQESEFIDLSGEALVVARLPLGDLWGPKRLAQLAKYAVADCAKAAGGIDPNHTALLLLAAEKGRPDSDIKRYHETFGAIEEVCRARFHAASAIFPGGRAGIGEALLHANKLLREQHVTQVLLVGVDSYLNAATIQSYLNQERLLCSANSNGFVPGEGAAAVLLTLAAGQAPGLLIAGVGCGVEHSRPDGEMGNRAFGLTQAIRQASSLAAIAPEQWQFRLSDQNGEQYFSREGANAYSRVMAESRVFLPVLTIADCIGEVGAATGILMLAYLSVVMLRADGPGKTGIMHLANDNGARSACVLKQSV